MMKRLSISLMAVAVIAMLVSGATFALFSASTTNTNNTFTAGTVNFSDPASTLVDVANIAPGDSGTAGTYIVTYTGDLQAWLGIDVSSTGAIFGGDTPLAVTVSDGATTYANNASDQVVGTVNNKDSKTFTVSYSMPLGAGNSYQGATGSISLNVHAVQFKNNSNIDKTGPASWQ